MRILSAATLALLAGCFWRHRTPALDEPLATPIPDKSALSLVRTVQAQSASLKVTRIVVEVGEEPESYAAGRAGAPEPVNGLLAALRSDPHFTGMRCEWGGFDAKGEVLFGLRGGTRVKPRTATLAQVLKEGSPGLSDMLNVLKSHDKDGAVSRLLEFHMAPRYDRDDGWREERYDVRLEARSAVGIDAFVGALETLESHFPTLRTVRLDVQMDDRGVTRAVARIRVYRPPQP